MAVRVDFRERSEYPPSQTGKAPEGRIGLIFLDKVRSHGFLFSPLKNFSPFPPPIFPNTIVIYIRYIYKLFIYSGN